VPVLADEKRVSYKVIGARKGGVGGLLGPKVVAKGAMITARTGMVQGRTIGNAAQLGGAMVIAPGGEVVFSQLARDAADNVSVEDLLRAVAR
jgi:uncharacterized membrane protein YdcZ (DUF606 family)